ncbi:hypothetical protein [Pseudomonas sp. BN102]|uniref:hypothetical protein n=1 Tax=Pseudomonas sp. BN102 TaxID=2567886 RepID=UPI002454A616|nr:hypothetical protein [Pseudomonas sp. BN102]MDH4609736.1 hypothetical protein [Pseudomonas sp. BN102]
MRLPVFRSSDLLPSAAEFIDYLFAKEGEPAWAATYPPAQQRIEAELAANRIATLESLLRDAHKYMGRCASPGVMVCSGKIVRYFADFRPLEQQP